MDDHDALPERFRYLRDYGCRAAGCDHEAYRERGLHAPNCTQGEFDVLLEEVARLHDEIGALVECRKVQPLVCPNRQRHEWARRVLAGG